MSSLLQGFANRLSVSELMDDHGGDEYLFRATLSDLEKINRYIGRWPYLVKKYIVPDLQRLRRKRTDRILIIADLGAGGCDIPVRIVSACRKNRFNTIRIDCVDNDPRAIRYMQDTLTGFKEITAVHKDVLMYLQRTDIDYVISNHLLHHLEPQQIKTLFSILVQKIHGGILIVDLRRHVLPYIVFTFLAGIFWKKGFTCTDGRMSIRRSYTIKELKSILEEAGVGERFDIRKLFPFHVLIRSVTPEPG
jgi:2-polyprenyl-3-methyl-5-hydroxy-6-metoxy-1,4-benzoquinol methylase